MVADKCRPGPESRLLLPSLVVFLFPGYARCTPMYAHVCIYAATKYIVLKKAGKYEDENTAEIRHMPRSRCVLQNVRACSERLW